MKRIILAILTPIYHSLICGICIVITGYILSFTPLGLNLAIYLAKEYLPGALSYAQMNGDLATGIAIKDLNYTNSEVTIHCDNLILKWNASQIFHHKIIIDQLQVNNIIVDLHSNNDAKSHFKFGITQQITTALNYFRLNDVVIHNVNIEQHEISKAHISTILLKQIAKADYYITSDFNVGDTIGKVELNYQNGRLLIHAAHALSNDVQFAMQGKITNEWNISWSAKLKNLSSINNSWQGRLKSDGVIKGSLDKPQFKAAISILNPTEKNLGFKAQQLSTDMVGKYQTNKQLLTIALSNTKLVNAQVQIVKQLNVALHGLLTIAGEFSRPQINFTAQVDKANATIPIIGIVLQTRDTKVNYRTGQALQINGHVVSGNGSAQVKGSINFDNTIQGVLHINGQGLQAINLHHYKVTISPDADFLFTDKSVLLKGDIAVPYANISPTNFDNVTTLPDEARFVDDKIPVQASLPMQTSVHIRINLSKQIHINYRNLQTNLSGSLQVDGEPGKNLQGTGSLYTINGKYSAYGKQLLITEGRLIYAGNALLDPGLYIRAVQQIKTLNFNGTSQFTNTKEFAPVYTGSTNITIGILVKGTLNKPIISLYSDSNLNQDDILSYLVFGYPRSQITKSSSLALLNSFASNMKTGKTSLVSVKNNVQNFLGLSEMDVGTTEYFNRTNNTATNATAINLGKQISKRLYLHYSVGIFTPIQILNLKYQINKHLSIQSETSSIDNGADVFYELERD